MVAGFDPPHGDAAGLSSAAGSLKGVASDLDTQNRATKTAVATAISQWRAPRADDFRQAGAGLQAELVMATAAVGTVSQALAAYAKALAQTTSDIASLKRQADQAQANADTQAGRMKPDDPQTDMVYQHAAMRQGQLARDADAARADLRALALRIAAQIDAETDLVVPGGGTLSSDAIRRKVDSSFGVAGLQAAAGNGTLTDAQAWAALAAAQHAVPKDAVEADGEVDWKKAVGEFNDKVVGWPVSAAALGTTPNAGWALYRLIQNQQEIGAVTNDLRTAFDGIVGPVALDLDRGLAGLNEVNDALIRFRTIEDAARTLGPEADAAGAFKNAAAGGLPDRGAIGVFGKAFAVLGVASDVMTIINPELENKTEAKFVQGAAAANILGTGAAFGGAELAGLVGLNAAADWIPVAGEVVMVGTGLFLAGDYAYHHWDQISNFATNTVPNALGDAASWSGHKLSDAGHAVTHFISHPFGL